MEALHSVPSLLTLCKNLITADKVTGGVILLLVALFFYMPSNMAHIKNLKSQKLIAFLNTAALLALPLPFYIPALLLVLSAFLAMIGRSHPQRRKPEDYPDAPPPRRAYPEEMYTRVKEPQRTGRR